MRTNAAVVLVCVLMLLAGCKREDSPEMLRVRTLDAQQNEDWLAVVEHTSKLLELDPNDHDARTDRAEAYLKLEKFSEDEADYDMLLAIRMTDPDLFLGRGVARMNLDNLKGACEDITEMTNLTPRNYEAHQLLGLLYYIDSNHEEAVKSFDRALKINRLDLISRAFRAQSNVELCNFESAILDLEVTLTVTPDEPLSLSALGLVRENQGTPWLAKELYQSAAKASPTFSVNIARLALVNAQMGEFEEAWKVIEGYDAALEKDEDIVRATSKGYPAYYRARIAIMEEDKDKTARYIKEAEAAGLKQPLLLWLNCELLCLKRDFKAALEVADKFTKAAPSEPAAWYSKAWCLFRLRKYEEAADTIREARKLRPRDATFQTFSASCALHLNDEDAAREFAAAAVAVDGTPVTAYNMLATLRGSAGSHREGIRAANDGISVAEDWLRYAPKRAKANRYMAAGAYAARIYLWEDSSRGAQDETKALDHLAVAIELGFDDMDWIDQDTDMDPLRRSGRFNTIIRK